MLRLKRPIALLTVLITVNGCENAPTAPGAKIDGIPQGWNGFFADNSSRVGLTEEFRHGGTRALSMTGLVFASISQPILATNYRGKRVRWSGWLKGIGITKGITSGLWMRVDEGQTGLAFDNMYDRPFAGTNDWTRVSIVLDVPENAIGIMLGITFHAEGRLIVDDLALEIVDLDVPISKTTNPFPYDSVLLYANAPIGPVNLDFEGTIIRPASGN